MKKILVLAGGYDQITLIEKLKDRNYEVILVDYYLNPPAKNYASKHYQISTLDITKVKEIARQEQVDLITTACTDQALLTMAKVSEMLNLPCYLTYEQALIVTNKEYMKYKLKKANIKTSDYQIIKNIDNINLEKLKYPLVLKPVDCNSSKGVKKIKNKMELKKELANSMSLSRSKTVILEEYNEGTEISIDAFILNGKGNILSITETKKLNNENNFTISGSLYPANISDIVIEKIKNIIGKISYEFNLKNCPLLIQAVVNNDDISVLEFSPRFGGGSKYSLINNINNIDIINEYINFILDKNINLNLLKNNNYMMLNYVYYEGIFDHLQNFDKLEKIKIIKQYFQYKTKGMKVEKILNSSDRVAGYLIEDKDLKILNAKNEIVSQKIKVMDKNNNNIRCF